MKGFRGLLSAVVVLTACASPRPAPPSPPTRPAPPAPSASVPPPSPPVAGPRLLDAAPADLAPELAEQIAFLSDLCPVALHYETEGVHRISTGCRSCPPFEGPAAAPDGKIAVDGAEFFALELLIPGHFTHPNAEQRLAVFNGCEPHSENWGGTVLAERRDGRFQSLNYFSGLHPQVCKPYRRLDGRDVTVCEFADAHQSISTDQLSLIDFAVDPPKQQSLISFTNTDLCLNQPQLRSTVEEQIESFEILQSPIAKNNGLSVRTTRTKRVMSEPYQRYCQDLFNGEARVERPYAKPQVTTRRYWYDADRFVAR